MAAESVDRVGFGLLCPLPHVLQASRLPQGRGRCTGSDNPFLCTTLDRREDKGDPTTDGVRIIARAELAYRVHDAEDDLAQLVERARQKHQQLGLTQRHPSPCRSAAVKICNACATPAMVPLFTWWFGVIQSNGPSATPVQQCVRGSQFEPVCLPARSNVRRIPPARVDGLTNPRRKTQDTHPRLLYFNASSNLAPLVQCRSSA